jgi:anti-sigma factor RsiW
MSDDPRTAIPDLTCQELVELVTDYLEGALPPADRARFEAHLADCPGCDAYLRQMRATLELVGATGALQSRPELSPLLEAFRAWKRGGSSGVPDSRQLP